MFFLHLEYYRYLEHVGINEDFAAGYRAKDEFEQWYKADPIKLQRDKLIRLGWPEDKIKNSEAEINHKINNAVAKAKKASFAEKAELYEGIFG